MGIPRISSVDSYRHSLFYSVRLAVTSSPNFALLKKIPEYFYCVLIRIFELYKTAEELQSKILRHYIFQGAHYFLPEKSLQCAVYLANSIMKS
jgi:hypothetical protein